MFKRIIAFLITIILVFSVSIQTAAAETEAAVSKPPAETELFAKSAVLMDADSGRILYDKSGSIAMANASTTKILTCILTLENCDLGSQVTVSSNAASQPKVRLGMREGQVFYLKDLLYGLMLESFNDCAVAIAEYIAGTTEGFAAMMNDKAKEIGCKDSYFITPNGLDAKDNKGFHHTTASDLALIMRYCIKISEKAPEFLALTGTSQHSFTDLNGNSSYGCYNHNAFLQMMEGAISGKTGFTGNAGYCYVGALERDGKTYIVALLACGWPNNKTYKWSDTKKLMNYGIHNFVKCSLDDIAVDESMLHPIEVKEGQSNQIGGSVSVDLKVQEGEAIHELLIGNGEEVVLQYDIAKDLSAPVEKGTYLGKISWLLGDEVLKECKVVAKDTIEEIDFYWCMDRALELLWL